MNILFEINHPAHFHLLKNPINFLIRQGHNISILAKSTAQYHNYCQHNNNGQLFSKGEKAKG